MTTQQYITLALTILALIGHIPPVARWLHRIGITPPNVPPGTK